jgi:hypothetical protein
MTSDESAAVEKVIKIEKKGIIGVKPSSPPTPVK